MDCYDVWFEIVHYPTMDPEGVVDEVTLRCSRLDQVIFRRLRKVQDGVSYVRQRLVKFALQDAMSFALAGVFRVGGRKGAGQLDLVDSRPPQLPPVLGNV